MVDELTAEFRLSEAERTALLLKGRQSVIANRTHWALAQNDNEARFYAEYWKASPDLLAAFTVATAKDTANATSGQAEVLV